MTAARLAALALLVGSLAAARPAFATFHLMQIEQVIAGVDGSTATQAIQLRMRSGTQNFVSNARIYAWDAAGANPVLVKDMTTNVTGNTAGRRVLLATANFASATNPPVTPDFILTSPIPDTYLAAGSLTFEDDIGTVYWRLCWGGANYTGPTDGVVSNDLDGNVTPAFDGPLPTGSGVALQYKFAATALSITSANDYQLTTESAVFTNNAQAAGTVISLVAVPPAPAAAGIALGSPIPNPAHGSMTFTVTLPRAMRVKAAIYSLTGRRIVPLVDGVVPAGRSSYSWDALDPGGDALAPGVYFVALDAEGTRRAQRFILLGRGQPLPHDGD
jgi:hypothetical protein